MRQRTSLQGAVLSATVALGLVQGCATTSLPGPNTFQPTAALEAPPSPPAPAKTAVLRWSLNEKDKTLKVALERWSQTAGWRLLWELGVDYHIDAAASVPGSFEDAVSAVMRNMEQAEVPPKAVFYRGNQVVRVVPRGME